MLKRNINFIGIGSPKCATTWISSCLREHPEIFIPKVKELRFFDKDRKYNKGTKHYLSYFKKAPVGSIKGEYTPGYINNPKVAGRIKKHFPNVKLIFSFRNPVDMLSSLYWYQQVRGIGKGKNFEDFIKDETNLEQGRYYKLLHPYLQIFPKKNIHIIIYKDIKSNPSKVIKQLYSFLGVDNSFVPSNLEKKIWVTSKQQFPFAKINIFREKTVRYQKNNKVLHFVPINFIISLFLKILRRVASWGNKKSGVSPLKKLPIKSETHHYLRSFFEKDIEKMEKIIDRKLDIWKDKKL